MRTKFQIKETVATILSEEEFIEVAKEAIIAHRRDLEHFISQDLFFRVTLEPYPPRENAPEIVKRMIEASAKV